MQVQFNKPVTLGKQTYGKGQHAVPAEDAKGWFFDALVADGSVVILRDETPKPVKAEQPKPTRKGRRKAVEPVEQVETVEPEQDDPETESRWG
jgi:hypothetical protein